MSSASWGALGRSGRRALLVAIGMAAVPTIPARAAGKVTRMDRSIVRVALDCGGPDYLEAEKEIVAAGAQLHPTIRAEAARRGPLDLAIAEMLLGWETEGAKWRACLERLDALGKKYAKSVIGHPIPEHVAEVLTGEFASSCVPLLSVRLLKEGANWPFWKAAGVLLHLRDVRDPRSTEPLLRFFLSAPEPRLTRIAAEALHALGAGQRLEKELQNLKGRAETLEEAWRAAAAK